MFVRIVILSYLPLTFSTFSSNYYSTRTRFSHASAELYYIIVVIVVVVAKRLTHEDFALDVTQLHSRTVDGSMLMAFASSRIYEEEEGRDNSDYKSENERSSQRESYKASSGDSRRTKTRRA